MNMKKKMAHAVNAIVRRSYWFNDVLFPDCKKFWRYRTFNTDVVNLGSTSGLHAFDYEGLPLKGSNWALSHNPLSGDYAILKNYFSFLNPERSTVLLSLCVFSSLAGRYNFMEDRFYTLLNPLSIPDFSYKRQRIVKSWRQNPIRLFPIYGLYLELKRFLRHDNKQLTESQMEADAQKWIKGWMHEFSISDFSAPLSLLNKDSMEEAAAILNEIIDFCKERNIRPVLVLPPMYHTLAKKFSPEARDMLLNKLIAMVKDKSVKFLNYMDDEHFAHEPSLFMNSFFLNKKGAKKFTRIVLTDLGLLS